MSKPLDELGGKCPYMPFLDMGQMSKGEHVRPMCKKGCDKKSINFRMNNG